MMLASRVAFGISAVLTALKVLGVPIPDRISRIADAVLLITSMGFAYKALRGSRYLKWIPKKWIFGGGLLIFVLLKPGTAWKAFKYAAGKVKDALPDVNFGPLMIAGLAIGGLLAFTMFRRK